MIIPEDTKFVLTARDGRSLTVKSGHPPETDQELTHLQPPATSGNIVDIGTGSCQQTYRIDRVVTKMPWRFALTQC